MSFDIKDISLTKFIAELEKSEFPGNDSINKKTDKFDELDDLHNESSHEHSTEDLNLLDTSSLEGNDNLMFSSHIRNKLLLNCTIFSS